MKQKIKVGALGPRGSNGHYAAKKFCERFFAGKDVEIVFIASHEEILKKVQDGKDILYGVVPIENSTRGLIREVVDIWLSGKCTAEVIAEQWIEIKHCLLMRSGGSKKPMTISSHPEALGQCRKTLTELGLGSPTKQMLTSSTAMAAKLVAEADISSGMSAAASRFCAEEYGLVVVKEDINDHHDNETRFHLIANEKVVSSKESSEAKQNKKVIVFKVAHKAGSLVNVLKVFSDHSLNMTSIHSVAEGVREEYMFYVEIVKPEGGSDWPETLIMQLESHTKWVRCIGTFVEYKNQ